MKAFLIFFQFILFIILISDNFYKDQSLYEENKFKYIQNIDFNPIKSLYKVYYENGSLVDINYETLQNTNFSIIKTEKYSKQCLNN